MTLYPELNNWRERRTYARASAGRLDSGETCFDEVIADTNGAMLIREEAISGSAKDIRNASLEAEPQEGNSTEYSLPVETPDEKKTRSKAYRWTRRAVVGSFLFMFGGNLTILGLSGAAKMTTTPEIYQEMETPPVGIKNFRQVDERVWRGNAPSDDGYEWLANEGVRTIVDLRSDSEGKPDPDMLEELGIELVSLPIRDGQTPSDEQEAEFLEAVGQSEGVTFVNCGAGVGRTGAIVASYLVDTGQASGLEAVWHNLSVGPPSLEQLVFAEGQDGKILPVPDVVVKGISKTLDSPRRAWSRWGI